MKRRPNKSKQINSRSASSVRKMNSCARTLAHAHIKSLFMLLNVFSVICFFFFYFRLSNGKKVPSQSKLRREKEHHRCFTMEHALKMLLLLLQNTRFCGCASERNRPRSHFGNIIKRHKEKSRNKKIDACKSNIKVRRAHFQDL